MSGTSPDDARGPRFTIRAGTPADAEAIWRVHRRSILELGRQVYTEAEVKSWAHGLVAERYAEAMTERKEAFYVAVDRAGAVFGFCSFSGDEIRGLYVEPAMTRCGAGAALLARAEADLRADGRRRIWLQASLAGEPFYAAMGYAAVDAYTWMSRGGLEIQVKRMEKTLD